MTRVLAFGFGLFGRDVRFFFCLWVLKFQLLSYVFFFISSLYHTICSSIYSSPILSSFCLVIWPPCNSILFWFIFFLVLHLRSLSILFHVLVFYFHFFFVFCFLFKKRTLTLIQ